MNFKINNIFVFLNKEQKINSILLIFLMLIAVLIELFSLGTIVVIINTFLEMGNSMGSQGGYFEKFLADFKNSFSLKSIISILLFAFSLRFLILIFASWMESKFIAGLREKLTLNLYNNFLFRDPMKIFKKNSSEYIRNFNDEVNNVMLFYHSIIKFVLDLILLTGLLIFLFIYNYKISFFIVIFFFTIGTLYYNAVKNKLVNWANIALENRKKKIQFINETFAAIKEIKIYSIEKYFLKRFSLQNTSLSKIFFKNSFIAALPRHSLEYILFLSIIFLIFFLNSNNFSQASIIQILAVYTLVSFRITPIISRILVSSQNIKFSVPSFKKLYVEYKQPIHTKNKNRNKFKYIKSLTIKIKNFKYDNGQGAILKDISINVPKGAKIGIVGPSGSGKSTIIDIICGLKKAGKNSVKVDGKCILDNINDWQNNIGYIPQDIVILNQSVKENILFGFSNKECSNKKILGILNRVSLSQFIKKLPGGLSHIIKQDGKNISGGEKQRIAIARSLIKNPEIIVLDEATSGLDTFTEAKIYQTIKKLRKTAIIVSHRVNSLNFCDKIYHLKNGKAHLLKNIK